MCLGRGHDEGPQLWDLRPGKPRQVPLCLHRRARSPPHREPSRRRASGFPHPQPSPAATLKVSCPRQKVKDVVLGRFCCPLGVAWLVDSLIPSGETSTTRGLSPRNRGRG